MPEIELTVSEFIASLNQTLEFAYPRLAVIGELANFKVSKGQWLYFNLKDEEASLKCFGSVFQLPGPLEDGMMLRVIGTARIHPLYGFSFNIQTIQPVGEGTIKRASDLLAQKLKTEGLFDESRKRLLEYPPRRIGLITSKESAAFADFKKILSERWGGVEIELADVAVQGDSAPNSIAAAISFFNERAKAVDALVIIRGGGSPEDLYAFSTEQVTRAVAGSRIPTLVAIGHEIDVSLAELAADKRASTPTNAAQVLVPDRKEVAIFLETLEVQLSKDMEKFLEDQSQHLEQSKTNLDNLILNQLQDSLDYLHSSSLLLEAFNPEAVLKRGYAIVRQSSKVLKTGRNVARGSMLDITLSDAEIKAKVDAIKLKGED